ncbi:hypothetical protein HAX54_016162 [Datura stramonium]|uniref:ZF-HD dimerization-type domain-containing protein n=1 Tax=Datura stramonium TaxID=4076 RepID=A0ABS8RZV6_DATST|nr:hypothetical protein [Datura stramonium]
MDLTTNTTTITTTTTTSSAVKTPEAETETPTRIPQPKPFPFSNGVLKRKNPLHHHQHVPVVVIYRECLKNHAANLGGHAVDGCGEFLPCPAANPADPTSLKCAACGCHRNFHRREPEEPVPPSPISTMALEYQPHHRHHPPPPPPPRGDHMSSPNSPSPPPISSAYYPASAPHMLLALSAGFSGDKNPNPTSTPTPVANSNGRKRFRTKFTPDQKAKMLEFAERVEWKMQKRDEDLVSNFCNEIGVEKGVLKVWMHNNKNTSGKKLDQQHAGDYNNHNGNTNNNVNGFCIVSRNNTHDDNTDSKFHLHHESSNDDRKEHSSFGANNVVATYGSSSSS